MFGLYFTCFPGLSPLFLPLSTRWQVQRSRKASGCITWECDTLLLVLVQETTLGSDWGLGELQAVMYPFHPSCSPSRKQSESHPVPQAFLKCGCNSAAPALTGSLLEIQIFFVSAQACWIRKAGGGPSIWVATSLPGGSDAAPQPENLPRVPMRIS